MNISKAKEYRNPVKVFSEVAINSIPILILKSLTFNSFSSFLIYISTLGFENQSELIT